MFELDVGLARQLREPRVCDLPRGRLVRRQDVLVELLERRIRLRFARDRRLRRQMIEARGVQPLVLRARLFLGADDLAAERKHDHGVQRDVRDREQGERHDHPALLAEHARQDVHRRPVPAGRTAGWPGV